MIIKTIYTHDVMKNLNPIFVPYNDNNISHVLQGPDYGQIDTGSKVLAWNEISSKEYENFVDYITDQIISKKIKFLKSPL